MPAPPLRLCKLRATITAQRDGLKANPACFGVVDCSGQRYEMSGQAFTGEFGASLNVTTLAKGQRTSGALAWDVDRPAATARWSWWTERDRERVGWPGGALAVQHRPPSPPLPQLAVACQSGGTCLLAPGDLPDHQHRDDPKEDLDSADGSVVDKGAASCLRGWLVEQRRPDQQASTSHDTRNSAHHSCSNAGTGARCHAPSLLAGRRDRCPARCRS